MSALAKLLEPWDCLPEEVQPDEYELSERLARYRDEAAAEYAALVAEIDILRDAIMQAMNNLGVPQAGYPAPVEAAYNILSAALRKDAEK